MPKSRPPRRPRVATGGGAVRSTSRVADTGRNGRSAARSTSSWRSLCQRAATASPPSALDSAHSSRPRPGVSGRASVSASTTRTQASLVCGSASTSSFQNAPSAASSGGRGTISRSRARVQATYSSRRASARDFFSSWRTSASQPGGWQPPRKPIAIWPLSQSGTVSIGE